MERISKLFVFFIRILGTAVAGYLFLQGLFTICTIQHVTERTFYVRNHALYAVAGIAVYCAVTYLRGRGLSEAAWGRPQI